MIIQNSEAIINFSINIHENETLLEYDDSTNDSLDNIFVFYENVYGKTSKINISRNTSNSNPDDTSVSIDVEINGPEEIFFTTNNSGIIHVIYMLENIELNNDNQVGIPQATTTSLTTCNSIVQNLDTTSNKDLNSLCLESCSPKKLSETSTSLYSTCYNQDEFDNETCNFINENMNIANNLNGILDCSYDQNCKLMLNTDQSTFQCMPSITPPTPLGLNDTLGKIIVSHNEESGTIEGNGRKMNFENENIIKNELINLINKTLNEGNKVSLLEVHESNNLFILSKNILFNDGGYTKFNINLNDTYINLRNENESANPLEGSNELYITTEGESQSIPAFTILGYEIYIPGPTTQPIPTTTPLPIPTTLSDAEKREENMESLEQECVNDSEFLCEEKEDGVLRYFCCTDPVLAGVTNAGPAQDGDTFVGNGLIEDFSNPTQNSNNEPSGVDYSWGSNF
jgi:hypothetical protein